MPLFPSPWHTGTTAGAVLALLVTAAVCYLLGCFNGAVIVSKYILKDDVRTHGSGNAGFTNFHRTFGGPLTALVILCDMLKGAVSVWVGVQAFHFVSWPGLELLGEYWAALCCLLGHIFPCFFQFRGGKGILSGGAIAIVIGFTAGGVLPAWIIPLTVWGGFLILAFTTRYISLGSCWAAASFPVVTWLVFRDLLLLLLALVIGGLILWKHRSNIRRLLSGTESKFTLHKKESKGPGA